MVFIWSTFISFLQSHAEITQVIEARHTISPFSLSLRWRFLKRSPFNEYGLILIQQGWVITSKCRMKLFIQLIPHFTGYMNIYPCWIKTQGRGVILSTTHPPPPPSPPPPPPPHPHPHPTPPPPPTRRVAKKLRWHSFFVIAGIIIGILTYIAYRRKKILTEDRS